MRCGRLRNAAAEQQDSDELDGKNAKFHDAGCLEREESDARAVVNQGNGCKNQEKNDHAQNGDGFAPVV